MNKLNNFINFFKNKENIIKLIVVTVSALSVHYLFWYYYF